MWLSLVERLLWEQDAAGSNPVIRTKQVVITDFVMTTRFLLLLLQLLILFQLRTPPPSVIGCPLDKSPKMCIIILEQKF